MADAKFKISEIPTAVAIPKLSALVEGEQDDGSVQSTVGGIVGAVYGQHVAYSGAAASHPLDASMNFQLSSNIGATGTKTFPLPDATVGLRFGALRHADFPVRFEPLGAQTIGAGGAGKYVELVDYGPCWVQCLSAGIWSITEEGALLEYET